MHYEQAAKTVRDQARVEYYHKGEVTLEGIVPHLPNNLNPQFIANQCELAGYPLKEKAMTPPYDNRPCKHVRSGSDWVLWRVGGDTGQKKVVFVVCDHDGRFLVQAGTKKKMEAWITSNKEV